MATPFWRTGSAVRPGAAGPWERPRMAGRPLPGRQVFLDHLEIKLRAHHPKASGKDGGLAIFKGLEPPKWAFELQIDDAADHAALDALLPVIFPLRRPDERNTVKVYHPTLARYGIGYCYVAGIKETPPRNGGPLTVRIECRVSRAKTAKAKVAAPAVVDDGSVPTIDVDTRPLQPLDYRSYARPPMGVR